MKGATQGVPKIDTLISVQGAYPIRITDAGVMTLLKFLWGMSQRGKLLLTKVTITLFPSLNWLYPLNILFLKLSQMRVQQ